MGQEREVHEVLEYHQKVAAAGGSGIRSLALQGNLTYKKTSPPRTLP